MVLFLDYDGTLSPIVDQPDKAFMKDGMRPVLAQVGLTGLDIIYPMKSTIDTSTYIRGQRLLLLTTVDFVDCILPIMIGVLCGMDRHGYQYLGIAPGRRPRMCIVV